MYNANKSLFVKLLSVIMGISFLTVFSLSVFADESDGDSIPPDPNLMMNMSTMSGVTLSFDPNDYAFLVYNPGNGCRIESALRDYLRITNYVVRNSANPVTPNDLTTHDILIIGWNYGGDVNGLHSDDLAAGITGRIVSTGHDLDSHIVKGKVAAGTMLS
jgi:hypothetical protein